MLDAQSVPRFTNASAETAAPPAAIAASMIDWSKRPHSSIRRISSSLTLAILDRLTFSCVRPTFQNPGAMGSDSVNSATTVLEKRSRAPFAPGKRRFRVLDAQVHHPVERQNPTLGFSEYVWQ